MNPQETWRTLAPQGYPQYFVSNFGRISKTTDSNGATRNVPISINQKGHRFVPLRTETGRLHQKVVNKIVANAFLPPEPAHIMQSVIHRDGNRANLHVSNLMWRPRWFAVKYFSQFKNPSPIADFGPVMDTTSRTLYPTIRDVAQEYGVLMEDVYSALEDGHGRVMFTDHHFGWEIT